MFLSLSKLGCGVNDSLFHARCSDDWNGAKTREEEKQREGVGKGVTASPLPLFLLIFFLLLSDFALHSTIR